MTDSKTGRVDRLALSEPQSRCGDSRACHLPCPIGLEKSGRTGGDTVITPLPEVFSILIVQRLNWLKSSWVSKGFDWRLEVRPIQSTLDSFDGKVPLKERRNFRGSPGRDHIRDEQTCIRKATNLALRFRRTMHFL